jgi:ATP-binding cassette subfamily G (WHITE) protein 2
MCGLNTREPQKALVFLGLQMLLCNSAVALSNMSSCIFVSIEMSTVILAGAMEITRLYSAFFLSPRLQDLYPKWAFFDKISYMKYGYIGLSLNEYNNLELSCLPGQLVPKNTGICTYTSGDQLSYLYGYNRYTIQYCGGCMVAYIAVCRLTSYLALRFIKV